MSIEELRKRAKRLNESTTRIQNEIREIVIESERVVEVTKNTQCILQDFDSEFEKLTKLDNTDMVIVFFAVMLKSLKWIVSPDLSLTQIDNLTPKVSKEDRLGSNERNHIGGIYDGKSSGAIFETDEISKYCNKHEKKTKESKDEFYKKKNKYRSWIEILTQPVPYDAMNALDKKIVPNIVGLNKCNKNGIYSNIYGKNHHVATLGHDPVLGWLFGTINIMSSTITFVDLSSYQVIRGHKVKSLDRFVKNNELQYSDQVIDYTIQRSICNILEICVLSAKEDYKRIMAAVIKQGIHFSSDKYCIEGLPIPLLSSLNPQKAQELIEKGWNSIEFEQLLKIDIKKIGISSLIDILINIVIEIVYICLIQTTDEIDIKKVKAKKIINIASVIASSSNILYTALADNLSKLDVGGIGVTLVSMFSNERFIQKLKQEYIEMQFDKIINNK